ncbi:MAG: ethanolamine ammonia-lyase reactivating factor EutA [Treponema sp.]|jgi:ethanolamine utilization protein EutA|nr:ethanolamine ammonia-lyase reactivating factor EutA [Treponema sp.]
MAAMNEVLLSVGIDLGTTTTQLVFSRLEIENQATVFTVPRIKIVDKKIIYRGDIHFTPLLNRSTIDIDKVRTIIDEEYKKAGVSPRSVSVGAVIITGEAARKENSESAINTLSGFAGDFVVAAAGSDLESILAGRGAGTADMSRDIWDKALVNLDIGGGTTNIGVFKGGAPVDTSCLDIGGRQIIIDPKTETLSYIAEKVKTLSKAMGLNLAEGQKAARQDIEKLCTRLAEILSESIGLAPATADLDLFITAHPLRSSRQFAGITYSGGVADFIYKDYDPQNPYPYGDIGAVLGNKIRHCPALNRIERMIPKETIRATVIGAGSNAVDISGSTIAWNDKSILPLQNVPIVKMTSEDEENSYKLFASRLAEKLTWFKDESGLYQLVAVGFAGVHDPSFELIKDLCGKIILGMKDYLKGNNPVILIIDNDMAKSLGYALMNALPGKNLVVLDSIKVDTGDFIDIGLPAAAGRVIPVVVKTLVFGK